MMHGVLRALQALAWSEAERPEPAAGQPGLALPAGAPDRWASAAERPGNHSPRSNRRDRHSHLRLAHPHTDRSHTDHRLRAKPGAAEPADRPPTKFPVAGALLLEAARPLEQPASPGTSARGTQRVPLAPLQRLVSQEHQMSLLQSAHQVPLVAQKSQMPLGSPVQQGLELELEPGWCWAAFRRSLARVLTPDSTPASSLEHAATQAVGPVPLHAAAVAAQRRAPLEPDPPTPEQRAPVRAHSAVRPLAPRGRCCLLPTC